MEKTRYHLEEDKDFPAREIFIKILRCYPPEHNKYEKSKDTYKRKIIPFMIELKDFLLKQMLKKQLAGIPADQQNKIIQAVEKNPKLFSDIAVEIKAKMAGGMDQQSATMQVMMSHQTELQDLMK
jgi:hypothetical protein